MTIERNASELNFDEGGGTGEGAEGLDPQDWDELRLIGHRMVDDLIRSHREIRRNAAWQSVPLDARHRLEEDFPTEGEGIPAAYEHYQRDIQPYLLGNST